MEATIASLTRENEELRTQLAGPSASGPNENNSGLARTLKELIVSEKRARIPKLHDYDGERAKLLTFCREAEAYIVDQGPEVYKDTEKAINIIAGYLTGNAAQWYTIAYHTRLENKKKWADRGKFWKEIKA